MNSDLNSSRVSPGARFARSWISKKRRPALLMALVIGLVLFLSSLPYGARAQLWTALRAQRGLVVLLVVFALVTVSLVWSAGQRLDRALFVLLNLRGYPAWLDRCMWLATQLGNMLAAFLAALAFFLLHYRLLAFTICLGTFTLWLVVEALKILTDRARPYLALEARVIGWHEPGESFPSGHTSQIFFLMTLFVQSFQPGIGWTIALYAVAALVGVTRIYVGAHYPRDVVAGIVLGSVWGLLGILADTYWPTAHFR